MQATNVLPGAAGPLFRKAIFSVGAQPVAASYVVDDTCTATQNQDVRGGEMMRRGSEMLARVRRVFALAFFGLGLVLVHVQPAIATEIYITSGTSFNFSTSACSSYSSIGVEAIGTGANGGAGTGGAGGSGGIGGAYSGGIVSPPSGTYTIQIGTPSNEGDTYFGGTSLATSIVGAQGGSNGGLASAGTGTTNFRGGSGGSQGSGGGSGGGGGGAAGPYGPGNSGSNGSSSNNNGGNGGSGDAGSGGAGGSNGENAGGNGTEYSSSPAYGSGGGGGGGNFATPLTGGAGGSYGAGGGGTALSGGSGGAGYQGLIVISCPPTFPPQPVPACPQPAGTICVSGKTAVSGAGGANTTLTITTPSGAAAGDYLVACLSYWSVNTITPPSGWTLASTGSGCNSTGQVCEAIYTLNPTSTPAASYSFTFSSGSYAPGGMTAYRNVGGLDVNNNGEGDNTTPQIPALTTSYPNEAYVGCQGYSAGSDSLPRDLGNSSIVSYSGGSTFGVGIGDKVITSAGAVGTDSGSQGSSNGWGAGAITLKPASIPPMTAW